MIFLLYIALKKIKTNTAVSHGIQFDVPFGIYALCTQPMD